MSSDAVPVHYPGEALAITLTVPEPWASAVAQTIRTLYADLEGAPPPSFPPHISLCQRFEPAAALDEVMRAIEQALCCLPASPIQVDGVHCFDDDSDGLPEVAHIAVAADWLHSANERLVTGTASYRLAGPLAPGNPAFELAGFTPHITVAFLRDLPPDAALRHTVAGRAAKIWSDLRPRESSFAGVEVVLSAVHAEAWSDAARLLTPRIIAGWRLSATGMPRREPAPTCCADPIISIAT